MVTWWGWVNIKRTVVRLLSSTSWVVELKSISRTRHPNLTCDWVLVRSIRSETDNGFLFCLYSNAHPANLTLAVFKGLCDETITKRASRINNTSCNVKSKWQYRGSNHDTQVWKRHSTLWKAMSPLAMCPLYSHTLRNLWGLLEST